MTKEFEDIRYTRTWLIETMTNGFLTLEHLDEYQKAKRHSDSKGS